MTLQSGDQDHQDQVLRHCKWTLVTASNVMEKKEHFNLKRNGWISFAQVEVPSSNEVP